MEAVLTFLYTVGDIIIGTIAGAEAVAGVSAITSAIVGATAIIGGTIGLTKLYEIELNQPDTDYARQRTVKGTTVPVKVVYGEALVSGPIAFVGAGNDAGSSGNDSLFHVVALTGHESEAITDVYLDNIRIPETDIGTAGSGYSGFVGGTSTVYGPVDGINITYINKHLGDDTTSDTMIDNAFAKWTSTHQGRGITYLATQFYFPDDDDIAEIWNKYTPNDIKGLVKGVKTIYDPRDDTGGNGDNPANASFQSWSDNPALCLANYLTDQDFGMGIPVTEIDWNSVADAADHCDETVTDPSGSPKRYTCNGVLYGTETHANNVAKLLSSMNGSLVYTNGIYVLNAGEYVAPSVTLTEDDLAGHVTITTASKRSDRFNTITGLYNDPDQNHKQVEFPKVTIANTKNNRDNGEELSKQIQLSFTNDVYMAQRLAYQIINRSNNQMVMDFPTNLRGLKVAVGDRVQVTLNAIAGPDGDTISFVNKIFICQNFTFTDSSTGAVNLTLVEDYDGVNDYYADMPSNAYSTFNLADGTITDGFSGLSAPTGISASGVAQGISLTWTNPPAMDFSTKIKIYRDPTNGSTFNLANVDLIYITKSDFYNIFDIASGTQYSFWFQTVRGSETSAVDGPYSATAGEITADAIEWSDVDNKVLGLGFTGDTLTISDTTTGNVTGNDIAESGIKQTIEIDSGGVIMNAGGEIKSLNKDSESDSNSGFFLGWNASANSGNGSYTFGVGDATDYLRYIDGTLTVSGTLSGVDGDFSGTIEIGSGNAIFKADNAGIYLGNATFASAPFSVTPAGALTATNAEITGEITATSLTIDDGATVAASSAFTRTPFVSFTSIGQTAFNPVVSGSEVTWTQVSGTYSWNHKLVSDKAFKNGAFVSFRVKSAGDLNTRYMIGLADVNTGTSYTQIDYAIYIRGSVTTPDILAYESGSNAGTLKSTLNVGDVCTVLYDDEKIKYIINGVVQRTVDLSSSPITAGLYAHIAIDDGANNATHTIEDFRFGSISDLALGVTIQDGGITMADGGSIKGGQTGYDTGTGFFLGYDAAYKFSIGNSGGNKLTFDGQDLTVTGAVNASSGTFSGDVSTEAKFIAGSNASTVTLDGSTGANYSIFAGADTSSNASFRVDSDGVVEATRLIVRDDANGQILIDTSDTDNPFSGVVYTSVSAGSGASVDTVAGTLDNDTDEITIVTTGSETFTITTKVAIDDNDGSTNNISGASTTSTSDAENQLIGSDLKVEYYLKEGAGAYAIENTQVIGFTAGTPTTSQIKVFGVDRGASYSGSLTRYFAVLQAGGAAEIATYYSTTSQANRARTYAVSTGTISISAAGTHKIKIVARLVDSGTNTTLTTATTPKLVDGDATGTYGGSGIVLGNEAIPDQSSLQDFRRLYEMTSSNGFVVDSADDTFSIGGGSTVLTTGGTISGNLVVTGDLTIQGTTTTIDTATLNVEDKNITLNYGTGDTSASADGSGITIQDAVDASNDATILWDAANDKFDFSHPVEINKSTIGGQLLHLKNTYNQGYRDNLLVEVTHDRDVGITLKSTGGQYEIWLDSNGDDSLIFSPGDGTSDIALELYQNKDADFGGNVNVFGQLNVDVASGSAAIFNSGTTNVVARFESEDAEVWIDLQDSDSGTYGALIGHDSTNLLKIADANVIDRFTLSNTGDASFAGNISYVPENINNSGANMTGLSDGWYRWSSTPPTDAPFAYALMVQLEDAAQKIQMAFGSSQAARLAIRRADSGTFYSWTEFYSTADFSSTQITNWDTAYTYSQVGHLPLAGGSLVGNLSLGSNNLTTINTLVFDNTEGSSHGTVSGTLMFDENFYSDTEYGSTSTWNQNGGGLVIYNEDGWGRIVSDSNMQFLNANFNSVSTVGSITNDFKVTDTDSNASFYGFLVDYDLSGSQTITGGNKVHHGAFIDVDSSQTGGTTTADQRSYLYGLYSDIRGTGQEYSRRAVYGYSETQHSAGTVLENVGVYGYGVADDTSSGHTTNNYGGLFLAYGSNTGSGGTTSHYGVYAKALLTSAADKDTNSATGVYGEVEVDTTGTATTLTNAFVFRAEFDNDSTDTTITNSYLFYGNYAGTLPTNAYGIYIVDAVENYFAGSINAVGSGTFNELTLTGGSDNLTFTEASGDWTINNAQQNNGIIIYDGTSGVDLVYNGTTSLQVDSTGVVVDTDFRVSNTATFDSSVYLNGYVYVDVAGQNFTLVSDTSNRTTIDWTQGGTSVWTAQLNSTTHLDFVPTSSSYEFRVGGSQVITESLIQLGTVSYQTTANVQSGVGSGGVALTINDGYGNANVTFNHKNGTPEQDGNAARIEVNTDASGGAPVEMFFELKSGVTDATATSLTNIMRLTETGLYMESGKVIYGDGGVTITADDTDFVVKDTTGAVTNFIWRDHSAGKLYLGASDANTEFRTDTTIQAGNTLSWVGASGTFPLGVYHATTNVVARFESGDAEVWIDLHDSNSGSYGALLGHTSTELFKVADAGVNVLMSLDNNGLLDTDAGYSVAGTTRIRSDGDGVFTSLDIGSVNVFDTSGNLTTNVPNFGGGDGNIARLGRTYNTASYFEVGYGSGAVGLTINDGGGNAQLTFNHTDETADADGCSARIRCDVDSSGADILFLLDDSVTTGFVETNNMVQAFTVTTSGVTSSGNVTAYSSDRRLKENFKHIDEPLEKIAKLNGMTFDWKDIIDELQFKPKHRKDDVGLIAQEVEEVVPQAVAPAPFDWVTTEDGTGYHSKSGENYKTVQYEKLIPLLVEGVKALTEENKALRETIDEILAKINED